jgi:hypothetical protein
MPFWVPAGQSSTCFWSPSLLLDVDGEPFHGCTDIEECADDRYYTRNIDTNKVVEGNLSSLQRKGQSASNWCTERISNSMTGIKELSMSVGT